MPNVSILIQAYNEEKNIRTALQSVTWADEVFVVDNYSTDATAVIVGEFQNVRLFQRTFDGYAAQKNWAFDTLPWSHNWIFILDADEWMPPDLQAELLLITEKNERTFDAYYVNRRIIFLGKWLKFGGWHPSWNIRLVRKGQARYENRIVHEHMIVDGNTGYLSCNLIHDDKKNFSTWLHKHNTFSTLEASEIFDLLHEKKKTGFELKNLSSTIERKRFLKERILYRLPCRPLLWFFYLYFFKLGFLDGWHGIVYSFLYAMQQLHTDIKLRELMHTAHQNKESIQAYWDSAPCGTKQCPNPKGSSDFFAFTRKRKYDLEYFIPRFAQFERWNNKKILEIGCGIGVDTAEFARHGACITAIDVSTKSLELARARLSYENLRADVLQADAEKLPFETGIFDSIYSWGGLHHTPDIRAALGEIKRVLKPGGSFCVMLYNKNSLLALQLYLFYGIFRFRLFTTRNALFSHYLERPGTRAYTKKELPSLFGDFCNVTVTTIVTPYDLRIGRTLFLSQWFQKIVPSSLGFFLVVQGEKKL